MALNEYVTITIALLLYLKVLFLVFFFLCVMIVGMNSYAHLLYWFSAFEVTDHFWLDFYYPINIFKFDLV